MKIDIKPLFPKFLKIDGDIMEISTEKIGDVILEKSTGSEQLTEFLINSMEAEAIIIDSNSIIRNVNNSFLQNNSLSRDQVIGQYCYKFKRCINKPCLRNNML